MNHGGRTWWEASPLKGYIRPLVDFRVRLKTHLIPAVTARIPRITGRLAVTTDKKEVV